MRGEAESECLCECCCRGSWRTAGETAECGAVLPAVREPSPTSGSSSIQERVVVYMYVMYYIDDRSVLCKFM